MPTFEDARTSSADLTMDESGSGRAPTRVVIVVSRRSPHRVKAWASSEELITHALGFVQEKHPVSPDTQNDPPAIRFLATERWDMRTYIVFDVFHDTYDPDKAHLSGENDLPVISIFLSQKEITSVAGRPMANKVNNDIRSLHNATGPGSRPPFLVDHADGKVPFYPNPRTSRSPSVALRSRLRIASAEIQQFIALRTSGTYFVEFARCPVFYTPQVHIVNGDGNDAWEIVETPNLPRLG